MSEKKSSKKLLFNNTYKSGSLTYFVVKEKNKFIGVCLEFDLSVSADSPEKALVEIKDYAWLWYKNILKNKLSEELLNRPAPKKYWKKYEQVLENHRRKIRAEANQTGSFTVPVNIRNTASFQIPYDGSFPMGFNFAH